jgi:thymidylate synthase (FAD)
MSKINVIPAEVNILTPLTPERCREMLLICEYAGRTCYQSKPKGDPEKFINGIVKSGHESVIEHQTITVEFVTDRACANELVRHRIAAYSQESTRYVNYVDGIQFIKMIEFQYYNQLSIGDTNMLRDCEALWELSCQQSADAYREMIEMLRRRPETARSVLNNSLKTSIIATFNLREWRHVFTMRCVKPAHPHIREIMIPLMMYFKEKFPGMFDDIPYDEEFYNRYRLYLESHVHEKWNEIIPPYHEEEPSPIIQALVQEENAAPEVDNKPIVIDPESETTRPLYTESSEPIEPMDYDEEVTLSSVVNKDASSNPTKDESEIIERLKEKGAIVENSEVKYLVEADLNGMYKYSPNGDKPMLKELAECTTKVRCRKILNLKSIGIVPYVNVGDHIHMMTTMVVDQNVTHSDILSIAKGKFVEILATQNKGEFIPYVMKITIQK